MFVRAVTDDFGMFGFLVGMFSCGETFFLYSLITSNALFYIVLGDLITVFAFLRLRFFILMELW